jgi:hypothetical protein
MTSTKVSHGIETFSKKYIQSALWSLHKQDLLYSITALFALGNPAARRNMLSLHACQER